MQLEVDQKIVLHYMYQKFRSGKATDSVAELETGTVGSSNWDENQELLVRTSHGEVEDGGSKRFLLSWREQLRAAQRASQGRRSIYLNCCRSSAA